MQYLNKILILLSLYLFNSLPILANEIVITRKASPSKALLDHKFIFMQGASSFIKDSQFQSPSQSITLARLTPKSKPISNKHSSVQPSSQDNWDAYAEDLTDELEESLDVEARLLN